MEFLALAGGLMVLGVSVVLFRHRRPSGLKAGIEDFAAMAGIELVVIDADTKLRQLRQELNWNEVAYGLRSGFVC